MTSFSAEARILTEQITELENFLASKDSEALSSLVRSAIAQGVVRRKDRLTWCRYASRNEKAARR